jgi:succinylglutamate desuccinylase
MIRQGGAGATSPITDFLDNTLTPGAFSVRHWKLPDGTAVSILALGAIELTPANPAATDRLLLSCGIHGNDTAPVEVVNDLLKDLLSGALTLSCHLMVLYGNPQAMRQGERYLDYDMNRLFNGAHADHAGARESHRAAALERLAERLFATAPTGARRLHFDLHTDVRGSVFEPFAIYPCLHHRAHNRTQLAWLQSCGIDTVLLHNKPANVFSYFTSRTFGVDALTLELGRARPFGHNRPEDFASIARALRALVSEPFPAQEPDASRLRLFSTKYDLIKHSDAFVLHLDDAVENFALLPDGFIIAEEGSKRYVAQGGNERILFPAAGVKNGLRAGIVVEPVDMFHLA